MIAMIWAMVISGVSVWFALWFHISVLPLFAEELDGAKNEYAKVKEELDTTMQELNEMWDKN